MSLRNPKRLIPRDLSHASITKARPADAAATNNIAGLEQDTCECRVPRAKEALARLGSANFRPRLAGPEKFNLIPCRASSQTAPTGSGERSRSSGSFLSFNHMVMADVESSQDFRKLELKGRF